MIDTPTVFAAARGLRAMRHAAVAAAAMLIAAASSDANAGECLAAPGTTLAESCTAGLVAPGGMAGTPGPALAHAAGPGAPAPAARIAGPAALPAAAMPGAAADPAAPASHAMGEPPSAPRSDAMASLEPVAGAVPAALGTAPVVPR
jgi:hypothetical protein